MEDGEQCMAAVNLVLGTPLSLGKRKYDGAMLMEE
jgi:hypothetical protein